LFSTAAGVHSVIVCDPFSILAHHVSQECVSEDGKGAGRGGEVGVLRSIRMKAGFGRCLEPKAGAADQALAAIIEMATTALSHTKEG